MDQVTTSRWLSRLCGGLLLGWCAVVFAGAPAPAPVGTGPHKPEHQMATLGDVTFEGGHVVKDFKVSYVTHGTLNQKKDNVILVMQFFTGDHHGLDFLIGAGRALDPSKYFIVATDFVGNSILRQDVTTGPTNSGMKMEFPPYTIRDSVNVEYKFMKEHLGIDHLLAGIGASIGAMKAYQLAVSYPGYVSGIVPIVGSPVTSPRTRWMLTNMMKIITLDGGWYGGQYETNPTAGLMAAFHEFIPWLFTDRWFVMNARTAVQRDAVERTWHAVFSSVAPQDARDVYYQLRMWSTFNVGDSPGFKGDPRAALASIKARALVIGSKDDALVSREEIRFAKDAIPNASLLEIDSAFGHEVCCGLDVEAAKVIDREVSSFLAKLR
jgi:homoserine O-acetyltransferase